MAEKTMSRDQLLMPVGIGMIAVLFIGYVAAVLVILRRKRQLSNLKPPEDLRVVRGPGETLRRQAEELAEQAAQTLLVGSAFALIALCIPFMLLQLWRSLNPLPLLVSGMALASAVSIVSVRRASRMLEERGRKKLGWYGERAVAEVLSRDGIEGAAYFHDVPMVENGFTTNIDHLVLTPYAAVVIETKMRSKPSDSRKERIEVVFNGECLDWPRFKNDKSTIRQVQRSAEWVERQVADAILSNLSCYKIVAIPGWKVIEKQLGAPRVVSGLGVAAALRQVLVAASGQSSIPFSKFSALLKHFDGLCRDTEI